MRWRVLSKTQALRRLKAASARVSHPKSSPVSSWTHAEILALFAFLVAEAGWAAGQVPNIPKVETNPTPIPTKSHPSPSPKVRPASSFTATAYQAELMPIPKSVAIPGLKLNSNDMPVRFERIGSSIRVWVQIRGEFQLPQWSLIYEKDTLVQIGQTSDAAPFEISVPLRGKKTLLKLTAIGPRGELKTQQWWVIFEDYDVYLANAKSGKSLSQGIGLTPALGYTFVRVQQSRIADFTEMALTLKLSFQRPFFFPNWDIALNAFGTAYTFQPSKADTQARFIGANFRVGYKLPFIKDPWGLSIAAGAYYNTMIVTRDAFGYRNITGPQLFPLLKRTLGPRNTLYGYFKYSPVGNRFALTSFDNREIAAGAGWVRSLKNGHPLTLSLDFANLKQFSDTRVDTTTLVTTWTLSLGYGF
jgi:hypothetical protein